MRKSINNFRDRQYPRRLTFAYVSGRGDAAITVRFYREFAILSIVAKHVISTFSRNRLYIYFLRMDKFVLFPLHVYMSQKPRLGARTHCTKRNVTRRARIVINGCVSEIFDVFDRKFIHFYIISCRMSRIRWSFDDGGLCRLCFLRNFSVFG